MTRFIHHAVKSPGFVGSVTTKHSNFILKSSLPILCTLNRDSSVYGEECSVLVDHLEKPIRTVNALK